MRELSVCRGVWVGGVAALGVVLNMVAYASAQVGADCVWSPGDTAKWVQLPDVTPTGIDVRVDRSDGVNRVVADDFLCTETGPITDVHLWGSWKNDLKGEIVRLHLSIHEDIPDPDGAAGPEFSQPGVVLWERTFAAGEFTEEPYDVVDPGEWWWDPVSGELIEFGDQQVWQIDVCVTDDPFIQQGTPDSPVVYWLDVWAEVASAAETRFGWKTRSVEDGHFNDDAVWGVELAPPTQTEWKEMRYPPPHPFALNELSVDMAFVITGEPQTEDTVVEFSLDIGSDTELSDPKVDGDEWFDPGDVYDRSQVVCTPIDGFKDDETIFGFDPNPDPDAPGSGAPVGVGSIAQYAEYFDLDAHDQLDFNLLLITLQPPIPASALPASECLHRPTALYWSYDDDRSPGWAAPDGDVPVVVPSAFLGRTYGSTAFADEILGRTVGAGIPAGNLGPVIGVANELMVNFTLWPNPDDPNPSRELKDDDVDSLDLVRTSGGCPYWYFSADHEGFRGSILLDPGDIYLSVPGAVPPKVIDNSQLGLPDGSDVDAFEFTVLPPPDGSPAALALLFSVDDDDPRTALDESGGLDSRVVYVSFLDGASTVYVRLDDDVDALALYPQDPVKRPNLQPFDPGTEPPLDTTLAKTQNNIIRLVFDEGIAVGAGNPVTIQELIQSDCEILGADLASSFTYSVITTNVANDTLRIRENGAVLTNQKWYRIKPTANLTNAAGVEPANLFVYDVCTLQGDCNNSCRVTTADYSCVKAHLGQFTEERYDLNGSGRVTTADYSVVKAHLGDRCPPKP